MKTICIGGYARVGDVSQLKLFGCNVYCRVGGRALLFGLFQIYVTVQR